MRHHHSAAARRLHGQRRPQQALEIDFEWSGWIPLDSSKSSFCFRSSKAEVRQREQDAARRFVTRRLDGVAVWSAIRVKESKAGARAAGDPQVTSMMGAVVGAAQDHELIWIVVGALGAWGNVMNVQEQVVPASGYSATTMVAA